MSYKIGDFVFGKMKGFPYWPGVIKDPPPELKKTKVKPHCHCIFFFGSKNYAYLDEGSLKSFEATVQDPNFNPKSVSLLKAIDELKAYKNKNQRNEVDLFDTLLKNSSSGKRSRRSSVSVREEDSSGFSTDDVSVTTAKLKNKRRSSISDAIISSSQPKKTRRSSISESVIISSSQTKKTKNVPLATPAKQVSKRPRRSSSCSAPQVRKAATSSRPTSPDTETDLLSPENFTSHIPFVIPGKRSIIPLPRFDLPPKVDVEQVSDVVQARNITPSDLMFGFLGVGHIVSGIIRNLVHTGHKVVIWNRTPNNCKDLKKLGVNQLDSPSDVINIADVTFCCVTDNNAADELVYDGNYSIGTMNMRGKAFVEMSPLDAGRSLDICERIESMGARYLEVRFQGNRQDAADGNLVVIASGDDSVFRDCESCFNVMGSEAIFLGNQVGAAAKLNSILQTLVGLNIASLAEGMALATKLKLKDEFVKCLMSSKLKSTLLAERCDAVSQENYTSQLVLDNIRLNIEHVMREGTKTNTNLPSVSAVLEIYTHAKRLGFSNYDPIALYLALRPY